MNLNTGNNRENSMKAKAGSSEKSQHIAKSLYRLKMKKKTQIANISNKRDTIITNPIDIKRVLS